MFVINEDKSIYITRGDVAFFTVKSKTETGEAYKFQAGDVIRFKVFEKKACENVVLSKDFGIEAETEEATIYLEEKDTKIGELISKPVDYWYEVELNPYTNPQTIVGYDEDGAKVFKLLPEGNEAEDDDPITPEDIPVVDVELSLTSTRPVQNQAIARAFSEIRADFNNEINRVSEETEADISNVRNYFDEKAKDLHGSHNKPMGTYEGNGEPRTIETGGLGSVIFISNVTHGSFIMLGSGGILQNNNGVASISYEEANFWEGVLSIKVEDTKLNTEGEHYQYQVL